MKTMRDVFIEEVYHKMHEDKMIFFLSADFGAPALDQVRTKFSDRFINVGIAEQNLINLSTGLALEGFTVYAYAISPFLTMRAYEQIRVNLSLFSQLKDINVNLLGIGCGLSYDLSGPTHHCLEDITVMRVLPGISIFSPSDWVLTQRFVDFTISVKSPKYIRLDGQPLPQIYNDNAEYNLEGGFFELMEGKDICIVSTGYMTHKAMEVARLLSKKRIKVGVIDVFLLKPMNNDLLFNSLKKYRFFVTLEEAFINKGGLDSLISDILENKTDARLKRLGFKDRYIFNVGNREYLHRINHLDEASIARTIEDFVGNTN